MDARYTAFILLSGTNCPENERVVPYTGIALPQNKLTRERRSRVRTAGLSDRRYPYATARLQCVSGTSLENQALFPEQCSAPTAEQPITTKNSESMYWLGHISAND